MVSGILLSVFLLLVWGFKSISRLVEDHSEVSKEEAVAIEAFTRDFYNFIDKELSVEKVKNWFTDGNIEYYIQDDSHQIPLKIVDNNSESLFVELQNIFLRESGKRIEINLARLRFAKRRYDAEGNVYVVDYDVKYSGLTTSETFILKKIGND
jgi:hypothetical protein